MLRLARSPEIAPAIGARKPWRRQAAQRFAQGLPPMTAGQENRLCPSGATRLSAHVMASPAFPTNTSSIRRGLAMAQMCRGSSHLESELE